MTKPTFNDRACEFVDRLATQAEEAVMIITPVYEALAQLLEYPSLKLDIESCSALTCNESAKANNSLAEFRASIAGLSLSELQELYTRTFDLSPVCTLDIGYHLFGENYKRGVFLANLRETEAPFELAQEHQLPDYLPVLLRLLTKLDDEELRSALIVDCMIPALEKMLKTLGEGENPYRHLIKTVRLVLQSEVGVSSSMNHPSIHRASLPVLASDPRNHTNSHEVTRMREFSIAESGVVSCELVDRERFDLKTKPDLF